MKLLIHDLSIKDFKRNFKNLPKDIKVISDNGTIHNCMGCFGCWIKTPGICIVQDEYKNMGKILSKSSEVTIISKCCYGGFSPFVKNVLDRSISYIHPYFTIRNKEMHHRARYKNVINLKVCFYGENITDREKKIARELVDANSVNLNCNVNKVTFTNNILEMERHIL